MISLFYFQYFESLRKFSTYMHQFLVKEIDIRIVLLSLHTRPDKYYEGRSSSYKKIYFSVHLRIEHVRRHFTHLWRETIRQSETSFYTFMTWDNTSEWYVILHIHDVRQYVKWDVILHIHDVTQYVKWDVILHIHDVRQYVKWDVISHIHYVR